MLLEKRINAFVELGKFLSQFKREGIIKNDSVLYNDLFFEPLKMLIDRAKESNPWFTKDNVLFAIDSWAKLLNKKELTEWVKEYNINEINPKTIAVIMAGNIPLVGFHDFLSVLISNHNIQIKLSSNDKFLLPLIAKYIEKVEPEFKNKIYFVDKLNNYDAVIATGSDNTARYFDYYFGKYPNIIRKNRNGVAVLSHNDTTRDLEKLGEDIFRYFGLGCRSVSKIFIPKGFDFDTFFKAVYKYKDVINYKKYENNYTYNKAVFLMSNFKLLENGFLVLKEDLSFASPIATLFYEYYDDFEAIQNKIKENQDKIQVIVSGLPIDNAINFGETQNPKLYDYADGVDTIKFLQQV
jgi:predicted SnoaL-like aldol condensation-catalyzing enzyme